MSQQLNLFNPIFLRQKKYFSAVTMLQCLGIVLIALIVMHAFQRWQLAGLGQQLVDAEAQFVSVQQQLTQFAANKRQPSGVLQDEILRLDAQMKAQEALLYRLESGELGNTEGFSRYLNALGRQTMPGVWLTGFRATGAAGPQIIKGRMLQPESLPKYLRMLNKEQALRGHGFAELHIVSRDVKADDAVGARVVEFTLGAMQSTKRGGR